MSADSFKDLSSFLAEALFQNADVPTTLKNSRKLHAIWNAAVPPPLGVHTRPIYYRDGRLVLEADSSTWAAMVRHQQNTLIRCLQRYPELTGLCSLHTKVIPLQSPPPAPPASGTTPPSPETVRLLDATAEHIQDPKLKKAFKRLARRARDKL